MLRVPSGHGAAVEGEPSGKNRVWFGFFLGPRQRSKRVLARNGFRSVAVQLGRPWVLFLEIGWKKLRPNQSKVRGDKVCGGSHGMGRFF